MERPDDSDAQPTSYDYSRRRGIEPIDWARFGALARTLVEQVALLGVEMVVGVARAGLFPAAAVACALRLDLTPVRVTRREGDVPVREHPVWKVDISTDVAGRVVVVVDEMASTGETLAVVAARVRQRGAARVVTAALCAHTWASPMPDAVALVSDALVLFPWDYHTYAGGRWQVHPEYAAALRQQGIEPPDGSGG
jgi:hypoxanthine phosphoribosyltransferase